jgi:hypothetical protein
MAIKKRWSAAGMVAAALSWPLSVQAAGQPMDVTLSVRGAPVEGDGCTGGDWTLSWQGQIPSDRSSIQDLLISYSSFDTTHVRDQQGPPVTFSVNPVTCKDHRGNVVVTSSISGGDRLVRGLIALKNDPAQKAPFFVFEVNDAGTCHLKYQTMQQDLAYPLLLRTTEFIALSPPLALTANDLREGFEKRYTISGQLLPFSPFCLGNRIERGELTLRYKRRDEQPKLLLAGCVNLPKGVSTTVQATATPPGGELTFESSPASMLSIQKQTNAARVTGATPGRGELKGTYTLNGKSATATLPASSIELISVNGGKAIPPMGYYGIDGKVNSKVYSIPVETQPGGASDLIVYAPENEAIVSVVANRQGMAIQPVREGRTLIQAKTTCGEPLGPPIEIEIRTCEEEVHRELTEMKERATHREREIVKRITQITGDDEFQRAGTEIKQHTTTLTIKTAELIAATLTGAQVAAVKGGKAVIGTVRQLEAATSMWDMQGIFNDINNGTNGPGVTASVIVLMANRWYVSALKGAIEAGIAAEDVGRDLGTLAGAMEQLELLSQQHDDAIRQVFDIQRRLNICEKLPPPPPLPPKQEPPRPRPPEQPPEQDVPPVDIPVEQPSDQPEPTPEEPTPPEGPEDPPRAPGSAGLCVRSVDEPIEKEDVQSIIQATQQYRTVAQRAREVFENFAESVRAAEQSAMQSHEAQIEAIKRMAAPFDATVEAMAALGDASREYEKRFALCTERLPVQIDQLKTRYGP